MKSMKKLLSLILVAAMVMAMSITTFAATGTKKGDDTTLTIATTAGHTYKVYQMLIGDVSDLTPTEKGATGTLANVELGTNNNADSVDDFLTGIQDDEGNYLSDAALGTAAAAFKTGNATDVVGDGTSKSITVTNGYYIVEDTWTDGTVKKGEAISRYMVAVVGATTMTPKADSTPDIDKNIVDTDANKALEGEDSTSKKTDTAAIGDVIDYEVTGTVPTMTGYSYYYYVLEDTLSDGLTLNDDDKTADSVANEDGFVVTVGGVEQTRGVDYVVIKDGQSFKLAFTHFVNYTAGAAISVKYFATVNKDAKIGTDPNTNTVKLVYSNNPNTTSKPETETSPDNPDNPPSNEPKAYVPTTTTPTGVTPERITKTYVTELTIYKVDENNQPLDGAEFTLTGTNLTEVKLTSEVKFTAVKAGEGEYYKLKDNTYTLEAPITETTYKKVGEGEGNYTYDETTKTYTKVADGEGTYVEDVLANVDQYESTTKDYVRETVLAEEATEAPSTGVVMTLVNGVYKVSGLNAGTYTLKETKTPTGYNDIDDIEFTITGAIKVNESTNDEGQTVKTSTATDLVGGEIVWSDDSDEIDVDSAKAVFTATIQNVKGNTLPSTGGIGTTIFYVLGSILVIGAGVVLVAKRRVAR